MMDLWYSKSIGDGMWAPSTSGQIVEIFLPMFEQAGKPAGMAVFTRSESEGRLHCEVIAYFSPEAGEVARQCEARPCGKPVRDGLTLLAGDQESWSALFG